MPMDPPLMKAEQNRAIRVEDLTEVVVGRSRFGQAKQRLVPCEAARDVGHCDDGPRASHWGLLWRSRGQPASMTLYTRLPPHGTLTWAAPAQESGPAVSSIAPREQCSLSLVRQLQADGT